MTIKRSGDLQYTARAFKQDSEDAMKGDPIRALIELITNADDAYNSKGGEILINFEKLNGEYQALLTVHDKATGLDAQGLEQAFARLGDLNKKFVGDLGTRGLFGRGAKDIAALGKARFIAIKKDLVSSLEIDPVQAKYIMELVNDRPDASHYAECRLVSGENGLTAQLYISKVHKLPNFSDLITKMQKHVQLRDLLNRNEVFMRDESAGLEVRLVGIVPTGRKVLTKEIAIPKYKHKVSIELFELESKDNSNLDEYSTHGLVISGRGVAYENSFLHLSKRPEAGWFCGRVDAPEIHDLARSIDETGSASGLNPTRIVSRQRDGLIQNHPYYRALAFEIEKLLKPIFDAKAEQEGSERKEGEKLRKRFDALSQVLANTLQEILDETDAGELPSTTSDEGLIKTVEIIPPRRIFKVGETATFTVRVPENLDVAKFRFSLAAGLDIFNLEVPTEDRWEKHPRLNVLQRNIRVTARKVGAGILLASDQDSRAEAQLTAVIFEPMVEVEPHQMLFEPDQARVAPTRTRNLVLKAPLSYVSSSVDVSTSSGLVQIPPKVTFKSSKSGRYAEALVEIKAGDVEGETSVKASDGFVSSTCTVHVSEGARNRNPRVKIEIVGSDNPPRRVDTVPEEGQLVIKIYARHKSLSRIFGKPGENGFEFEGSPAAQASMAEMVAHQLSVYAVERDAEKHPDRYQDAPSIFYRQQEFIPRFIVALQSGLLDLS